MSQIPAIHGVSPGTTASFFSLSNSGKLGEFHAASVATQAGNIPDYTMDYRHGLGSPFFR
jgi:hypothetical protein